MGKRITFIPSNVHSGHYITINGTKTSEVINLHAYQNPDCKDYQEKVNAKILELCKKVKVSN